MNRPRRAARRCAFDARTVLTRKDSLRRAEDGAPLRAPRRSGLRKATTGGAGGMILTDCGQRDRFELQNLTNTTWPYTVTGANKVTVLRIAPPAFGSP